MRFFPILSALWLSAACLANGASPQPNIIVYMVDDLGWNHVEAIKGSMGTVPKIYETPEIARLAKDGLSFTHAYAQPNCAPTRAAMLSGQYPARIHNDVYVVGSLNRGGKRKAKFKGPKQSEDVAVGAVTVAEALRENGYATAHIGKYHVGGHEGGEATLPQNAGFDINIGGSRQGHQGSCFATQSKGKKAWGFRNVGEGAFDKYAEPYSQEYLERLGFPASLKGTPKHVSDAVGDALEETVGKLEAGDKPFYIQFHTYAVHGPVRARPDLLEEAKSRLGNSKEKGKVAQYLGFIAGLDVNLARMRKMLEDPDGDGDSSDSITDNTLILFTSDNGGTHADNLPLKGNKGMLTEGGMRVPLIACWPGVIPADTVTDNKVHSVDYYPTFLELAGSKWSPPADEHPLDGHSFAKALRDPSLKDSRDPVFFLFPGYLDIRAQPTVVVIDDIGGKRFKLFYLYETNSWELYCLTDDQEEARNLIEEHPEIAKTLSVKMLAWLAQEHPTWKPKYPLDKESGESVGPPPGL
ncbi:sulfatase [Haloferula sp.]|uniref:sulfatase n=1 Tax=Haloferula sp. TaxID=2497595 RepID=UPI0032A0E6FB